MLTLAGVTLLIPGVFLTWEGFSVLAVLATRHWGWNIGISCPDTIMVRGGPAWSGWDIVLWVTPIGLGVMGLAGCLVWWGWSLVRSGGR